MTEYGLESVFSFINKFGAIYLTAASLILTTGVLPTIGQYMKSGARAKRYVKWCLEKGNKEFQIRHWLMLYLLGNTWFHGWKKTSKKDLNFSLEAIDIRLVKKKEIREFLENTSRLISHYNDKRLDFSFWRYSIQQLLKEVLRKGDYMWYSNKELFKVLRSTTKISIWPILTTLFALTMFFFYGCSIYYISVHGMQAIQERPTLKESSEIREHPQLENPSFLANKSCWSISRLKGISGILPPSPLVDEENCLIVNTPNKSKVVIAQNYIMLAEVRHHDYYLLIDILPGSGGENAEIEYSFIDPFQDSIIEGKFTVSNTERFHKIRLPSHGGTYNLLIMQNGLDDSIDSDVICRYNTINILPILKPGTIGITVIEKNHWQGERIKDFSEPDQGDVDFYKLFRYLRDGEMELVKSQHRISQLSSETYIANLDTGLYRVVATFGGITYGVSDSIFLDESCGKGVIIDEIVWNGKMNVSVKSSNPDIKVDSLRVTILSHEEVYVRGFLKGWSEDEYIGSDGYIETWLLPVILPEEYYIVKLVDLNNEVIHQETGIRPKFEKHGDIYYVDIEIN